jgi:hypothetical protein
MNQDPRTANMKSFERKNIDALMTETIEREQLATYLKELGLTKVKWAAAYVRRLMEKGEKILLFAWHREVAQELFKALVDFNPRLIIGGVSTKFRDYYCGQFQEGVFDVMICNIAAMSRGRNLQRASRVVFVEYAWSDEANRQAEKRTSRKGSTRKFIKADYLVVPNSLDEMKLRSVFTKATRTKKVIG